MNYDTCSGNLQESGLVRVSVKSLIYSKSFFDELPCKPNNQLNVCTTSVTEGEVWVDGVSPSVFRCTSTLMETGPIDACVKT